MNLYQVTSPALAIGGITVKAKTPYHASEISRVFISENYMADVDDRSITLCIRKLIQPDDDGPGYCHPEAAEHIYQVTLN